LGALRSEEKGKARKEGKGRNGGERLGDGK